MTVFKLVRIVILLSILFVMVVGSWMNERRLASWERPIWVTIYPILASNGSSSAEHARSIHEESFDEINQFFERNLSLYGVSITPPLRFQIAEVSSDLPPAIPDRYSLVSVGIWSLKMRWWSWRKKRNDGLTAPDIQMFVLYHELGADSEMQVSVGMRKGMYGLVKAYSGPGMEVQNQIVIAHELLHVLGATDKYVFETGNPEYPYGFAEPNKQPLFPQSQAEIMGGRIPLNAYEALMPASLSQCRIGRKTAEEIGLFAQLEES